MNILQDRLSQIAKTNQNNQFKHRIGMITKKGTQVIKSEDFKFQEFIFNGNMHSNKIENEKFTNFLSSYDNTYYEILDNLFDKLYKDNYDFLNEFELEENNYSEISDASKRLKRIIMEVNNIPEVPQINEMIPVQYLKRKEKRYKGIRFFVHVREDGYIELYLIDLYHLGINAYNASTGSYDLERNYNSNKGYSKCISKIADKYINDEPN